jgi:hypothetical protein
MRKVVTLVSSTLLGAAMIGTLAMPAQAAQVQPNINCRPCNGCC